MTAAHVHEAVGKAKRFKPKPNGAAHDAVRPLLHVFGDQLPEGDVHFTDELIEGVIGRGTMAVLYGDSNSGKTFLAVDMAGSVSRAADWLGRRTEAGAVLYLATEAAGSVQLRFQAYQRHHSVRLPHVVIVQSPISLFDDGADLAAVLALAAQVEAKLSVKVTLIIGDTLARVAAGANENSGEDMAVVFRNADAIIRGTGAAFLWIHHHGKDAARGMRGWSGMRAHIDTEIEIACDDATGLRSAEVTKQRDLPGKGDRYGFKLLPLTLGHNQWDTPRTSCVVESTEAPPPKQQRGKRPSEIEGAITVFLGQRGTGIKRADLARILSTEPYRWSYGGVRNEVAAMLKDGRLVETVGIVALPGKPGPAL